MTTAALNPMPTFLHEKIDIKESNLKQINRKSGRVYMDEEGNEYPSITSVLSILSKDGIQAWRERMGEEEANRISRQAIKKGKIQVFGGNQYRPFLNVEDAADSLIFALEKNLTGVYNVVSENLTISEASQRIKKLSDCEIEVLSQNEDKRKFYTSD